MNPVDIFIAYSHNDKDFKENLRKFLTPMLREGRITLWDDFYIQPGQRWDETIKERLWNADIVLLLVSAESLASDYFYGEELRISLDRNAKKETEVVPIILSHCDWQSIALLSNLQALPENGLPVVDWLTPTKAYQNIVDRLRILVDSIVQRRQYLEAAETAYQLYEGHRWSQALEAFQKALLLHQRGLLPDVFDLKKRLSECETAEQQEKDRDGWGQRKEEFQKMVNRAKKLFNAKKWGDAKEAFLEALRHFEAGFTPDIAELRDSLATCEDALQNSYQAEKAYRLHITEAQKQFGRREYALAISAANMALHYHQNDSEALRLKNKAETALQHQKPSKEKHDKNLWLLFTRSLSWLETLIRRRWMAMSVTTFTLLAATLLYYTPPKEDIVGAYPQPYVETRPVIHEDTTKKVSIKQGRPGPIEVSKIYDVGSEIMPEDNIRALRNYLKQYQNGPLAKSVQAHLDNLMKAYEKAMSDATIVHEVDPSTACEYIQYALKINPDAKEAQEMKSLLGCN